MIRINLLPHREEKRKARLKQYIGLASAVLVAAAVIILAVHAYLEVCIDRQDERNKLLKKEILALDKEIDEIKKLKDQSVALLARKQVIETLQSNRTEAVGLFNELVRLVPDGIYLKSLKQTGQNIAIAGYAQSNARISTLMHNFETSSLLENPVLVESRLGGTDKKRINEFNLTLKIKRAQPETAKKGGKP